jgi:hypothetical protein
MSTVFLVGGPTISLSSRLMSINVKIRTYRIIILPVVLYGYEIRSLT